MKAKRPIKSLKPSMRENKRYLLIYGENLKEEVEKAILEFIGILGMSKTGLTWIKYNKEQGIASINREMLNQVRASLCIWSKKLEIRKVSGTLKGLGKK
jgi:RNase P/RNase MRP subunit POP5